MSELAAKLGITKGAVTQIVGRLEEREFVKRHPHPNDSRSVVVSLEERGKTAFHVHEKLHEEFIHSLREELGEEGYLCFEKGIAKFISFLGK
ncbi:MAG: MarR family transcriptional regulator [Paenibacillus sp.]|nr:MarR family transcriptional regulator [Paenibacillus sp.]